MSEMVEKAARAMAVAEGFDGDSDRVAKVYARLARATIGVIADEIDTLVEKRRGEKKNRGNDYIAGTAGWLRCAALAK